MLDGARPDRLASGRTGDTSRPAAPEPEPASSRSGSNRAAENVRGEPEPDRRGQGGSLMGLGGCPKLVYKYRTAAPASIARTPRSD
jgi:hypothetical protein